MINHITKETIIMRDHVYRMVEATDNVDSRYIERMFYFGEEGIPEDPLTEISEMIKDNLIDECNK